MVPTPSMKTRASSGAGPGVYVVKAGNRGVKVIVR